jgi:2-polyprenyl-6-methoxyphenol hydroxylase-like FAD-dependent oxidoreductase
VRLAGSVLAALLAQPGHRGPVLEKAHFPSDMLSTHFFCAPALRVFERLGSLDDVRSAAPPLWMVWNYIDGHVIIEPVRAIEDHLSYFLCERRIALKTRMGVPVVRLKIIARPWISLNLQALPVRIWFA